MILDSKSIKYDVIDITEPGKEADKEFMQNYATSNGGTVSDPNPRSPLPPQLFNEDEYCGVSITIVNIMLGKSSIVSCHFFVYKLCAHLMSPTHPYNSIVSIFLAYKS